MAGRRHSFYGYAARGAPWGSNDGTLSGPSVLASLAFAPEIVLPAVRRLLARGSPPSGRSALASGYNDTVRGVGKGAPAGWISDGRFGFDQGMIVLMIENARSGLVWRLVD